MIFDTHCHLNDEQLLNQIDAIVQRAKEVGVEKILVVGWDKNSSLKAVELASKYQNIYAAVGFHPCNVFDISEDDFKLVMDLSKHPKVVAIGEIGLDYHWISDPKEREIQKQFFIRQIEFANKNHLPISIHNRDAFLDCLSILKEHKPLSSGVMHCYSGSVESLKDIVDLGLFISLGGPVTFLNAKKLKEVAEFVPLDRLVVETDSPYLAPHPLRGTINEPKNICLVVDTISQIRKCSKKHLLDIIYQNSCKVFHVEI